MSIEEGGVSAVTAKVSINWDAERTAFERWFVMTQTRKNHVRVTAKAEDGTYIDGLVRVTWRAWRHAVHRGAAGEAASSNT